MRRYASLALGIITEKLGRRNFLFIEAKLNISETFLSHAFKGLLKTRLKEVESVLLSCKEMLWNILA